MVAVYGPREQSVASVRRSFALSFLDRYSSMAIHFVGTVILARLLTPEDIGIFSVGAAFVILAHTLRNFGVPEYIIKEKDLTDDKVRTAFGITFTSAWTLCALLALASGPIARFYDEPGLRWVVLVMAGNFFVLPLGAIAPSYLRRNMDFAGVLRIGLAGSLAHVVTGVTLAVLGFGYMSLAWASFANMLTTAVTAWLHRPRHIRIYPSFKRWREVVPFGLYTTGGTLVSQGGVLGPDLILGRLLGFEAVGLFSRANGLIKLFERSVVMAIQPVAASALAQRYREGLPIKDEFLRGLGLLTAIGWPAFLVLGLLAYPVVRILYGDQWDAAVPLVQILCAAAALDTLARLNLPTFQASGEMRRNFHLNLIAQPIKLLLIVWAAHHDLTTVAAVVVVAFLIETSVSYAFLVRVVPLTVRDVATATWKSGALAMLTGIGPAATVLALPPGPDQILIPFLLGGGSAAAGWLAGVYALDHPIRGEIGIAGHQARSLLRRLNGRTPEKA